MAKLKNAEHLLRLAGVFAIGVVLFLVLRAFYIPQSFGQYGHYRGNAIQEMAARPISFAGHKACEDCHADVVQSKHAGKHAGVNCEACHGPLAAHADDPSVTPQLPDTLVLCARCHEANLAKPKAFPQVDTKDHMGDVPCKTCHQPHDPAQAPVVKKDEKKEGKKP